MLGLHCSTGFSLVAGHKLLIAVASLVVEHGLQDLKASVGGQVGSAGGLSTCSSLAGMCGLSCSATCGIFPDLGSNSCPSHWQADSYSSLDHQGRSWAVSISPSLLFRLLHKYSKVQRRAEKFWSKSDQSKSNFSSVTYWF